MKQQHCNARITLGSLFDGIGGFPLSGIYQGIAPLWASEIEPFPIEVTKIRFPQMLHVGDITKLNGAKLPIVDLITGGSPCQDLSVAGQRAGLAGERSGLFMEQIRIVKEMRCEDERAGRTDDAVRPRYMLWENVPGAFSSSNGEDFRAVLEETARIADNTISIPRPTGGAWKSAGCILGGKFSIAWRVLDAQHWFLAQRRRRIFLVADFTGHTAPQILFEQDRLLGDFAPSRETWQGAAAHVENSLGDAGRSAPIAFACNQRDEVRDLHDVSAALCAHSTNKQQTFIADTESVLCFLDHGGERFDVNNDFVGTLKADIEHRQPMVLKPLVMGSQQGGAEICTDLCPTITSAAGTAGNNQPILCLNDQGGSQMSVTENIVGTLRAQEHGHQSLLFDNHPKDARYTGPLKVSPTLAARAGTGGNNLPLVSQMLFEGHGKDARYSGPLDVAPTVASAYGEGGGNIPLAMGVPHAFSLDSAESNSMKSKNKYSGCRETDLARTIDTTNPCPSKNQGGIAIVQESYCIAGNIIDRQDHNGGNGFGFQSDISYTLTATDVHAIYNRQGYSGFSESDIAGTQCARQYKDATDLISTYQTVVGSLCHGDEKGIGNQYVSQDKCIVQPKMFGQSQFGNYAEGCSTLRAQGGDNGGGSENLVATADIARETNLVRRLTPLECERLMGYPDGWTSIPKCSDSARYKALGNSVAIPCVEFILRGIAYFLLKSLEEQEEKDV